MKFDIKIAAPREKVWRTLFEDDTYRDWTSVFAEGSKAETDWKKGSKVLFLDGKGSGMVSKIYDNIPNEYMSIQHVGVVKNGVESTSEEDTKGWAGSFENYTLKDQDGNTHLYIEMSGAEIPAEYVDYFKDTWPKALNRLKEISEKN